MFFNKHELSRYSRQILFFGKTGQSILKKSCITVIGAGGLGSALLPYLASSGVGTIQLFEFDVVEESNLSRQTLYTQEDVGLEKGLVVQKKLYELNPYVNVEWLNLSANKNNLAMYSSNTDLIIEGSDSILTKLEVNSYSCESLIPCIIGALGKRQSHILPIVPENLSQTKQACYNCLFGDKLNNSQEVPTCAEEGILSILPGLIGSYMAYLTLVFLQQGQAEFKNIGNIYNYLYLFEYSTFRRVLVKRKLACIYCNI